MGPAAIGAIAQVGSSLIGSILGRKKKTSSSLDLKKLRQDAVDAGFNPLTVLQSTGGSGHMSQQTGSDDFDVFGATLQAGLQGLSDYHALKKDREVADAQLDLIKAQTQSLRGELASRGVHSTATPVRDVSENTVMGDWTPMDPEYYYQTQGPYKGLYVIPTAGGFTTYDPSIHAPAEIFEGISGDLLSEAASVGGALTATRAVMRPPVAPWNKPYDERKAMGGQSQSGNATVRNPLRIKINQ